VSAISEKTRYGMRGYTDRSRWVPSVSAMLDVLAPMPRGWIDEKSLADGGMLHRALFLLSKNEPYTVPHQSHSAFPRVDAAIHWFRSNGYTVMEAETPRIARAGYGGRPDALLAKGPRWFLAEVKFAESLHPRYEVQLELYRRLDFGMKRPIAPLLLQITKAGDVKPKYLKPNPGHYAAGLNALNALRWRINHGK